METRKSILNESQQNVVSLYDVPENEFEGRDWFNDFYHVRALEYLLYDKKFPLKDVFAILDNLNADQANGIYRGLDRSNVVGLTSYQINTIIKFGLSHEEVKGLNEYQINAYLKLRDQGLTIEQVRKCYWLTSAVHVRALGYLYTVRKLPLDEAFKHLSELNEIQASSLYYGLTPDEVTDLEQCGVDTLITAKKYQGLQKKSDVVKLNSTQIDIVKDLFHWGITSDQVRAHPWLLTYNQQRALSYLVAECFFSFDKAIAEIKDLKDYELEKIRSGLLRSDMQSLNQYQIDALAECKTAKNELSAASFKDKPWFNSEDHVDAFRYLLACKHFTVQHALEELAELRPQQLNLIKKGEAREDIIELNEWMIEAVNENEYTGLTYKHFKGKNWFNSDLHVKTLYRLIKVTKMFGEPYGHFDESMLTTLKKMDQNKLQLMLSDCYTCAEVKALTPIQAKILVKVVGCPGYNFEDKIEHATWLKTDEQYDAYELLCNRYDNISYVLEILNNATTQNRVSELLSNLTENVRWDLSSFEDKKIENSKPAGGWGFLGRIGSLWHRSSQKPMTVQFDQDYQQQQQQQQQHQQSVRAYSPLISSSQSFFTATEIKKSSPSQSKAHKQQTASHFNASTMPRNSFLSRSNGMT